MNMEQSINALLMDERDNVVTCVKEVKRGQSVAYQDGAALRTLVEEEDIPYCHKIALTDLSAGKDIIKYGESLGKLVAPVKKGHWVNDQNLKSVPRDYESELAGDDFVMQAKQSAGAPDLEPFSFWGYRRAEGRPGVRNHVLILPTCACGSECCRIVASQVRGAVNIVFNTGCSDVAANTAMSQKVLTGFACNPNVYGVVIIGLGCETVPHAALRATWRSRPACSRRSCSPRRSSCSASSAAARMRRRASPAIRLSASSATSSSTWALLP